MLLADVSIIPWLRQVHRVSNQIQLPSPPTSQADLTEFKIPTSQEQPIQSLPVRDPNRPCQTLQHTSIPLSSNPSDTCVQTDSSPLPLSFPSAYDPPTPVVGSISPGSLLDAEKTSEPIVPFGSPRREESLRLLLLPADYTVTCDHPTLVCGVGMSLFDQQLNEPVIDGNCESNGICHLNCCLSHLLFSGHPADSLTTLFSSVPCDHSVDTDTFSSFLNQSFSDEQSISLFSPTDDHHNSPSILQKTDGLSTSAGMEAHLKNSGATSYWHAEITLNEQSNHILSKDRTESFAPTILNCGTEKARQVARLEALKQQKAHLEEHIQFL